MAKELLNENQLLSVYVIYQLLKKLVTPFEKTEAYKLGIIDQNGNVLRKRNTLKTRQELEAYTVLDTLIFNIKKLIQRLPGGKSRLASFAAALWLIKECRNYDSYLDNEEQLCNEMQKYLDNFQITEENRVLLNSIELADSNIFEIANVTGAAVATDMPFKPMVKQPIRRLHQNFLNMYQNIEQESKNLLKKVLNRANKK